MKNIVWLMAGLSALALQGCASYQGSETSDESVAQADSAVGSATLTYTSDWGTGFCVNVTIQNGLTQATSRWQAVLDLKTTTVTSTWNAKMSATTGQSTATPMDYNTSIAAGASTTFGFCANAPSASVRPVVLAWNMESNVYATCSTSSGLFPAKAALAVAMANELGRWTPTTDLVSNGQGRVVLSSAGLTKCGSAGCPNTKAILGQQDAYFVDQQMFNATNYASDLIASFDRQNNLIANLNNNNKAALPPPHKLTKVGGPTNLGLGSCGPHYIYQVDHSDGTALTSTEAANMANALCFYGYGGCGNNTYLAFAQTTNGCPSGRTCVAIDPTDGDNSSTSTTTAGSAPTYPMNRVYDPTNALLGTACIMTNGTLATLKSKCATYPTTCGYLYCML